MSASASVLSPKVDEAEVSGPPPLPPKDTSQSQRTSLADLLFQRQAEQCGAPGLNLNLDFLSGAPVDLNSKVTESMDPYWVKIIHDYSDRSIRLGESKHIEEAIISGIPADVKPLVYLKTLQIRSIIDENSYLGIVKRAKLAGYEGSSEDSPSDELTRTLHYILKEVVSSNEKDVDKFGKSFATLIGNSVFKLETLKEEKMAILLKLNALLTRISWDAFTYKASRALEDTSRDLFVHITSQGINLVNIFKHLMREFLSQSEVSDKIADFVIFEGVDFMLRLLLAYFQVNEHLLTESAGDSLNELLHSNTVGQSLSDEFLTKATEVEFSIMKYENEFHLMHVNSISGNDNELINLKEANEDLSLQITSQKSKLDVLKNTTSELMTQQKEYSERLEKALLEKEGLSKKAEELKSRYSSLTMKENLDNTVKANKEISTINADLEAQIQVLDEKVSKLKAKLEKLT